MALFSGCNVDLDLLKKRAFNLRWAEVPEGVIPLTAADSDFPCAPEIRKALKDYIDGGYFSYTPPLGLPEFKEAISNAFARRKGEIIDPELILPIDSAARGMSVIASAFIKPGDEALVCDPVDFLFKTSMEAAGATIRLFPTKLVNGKIDFSDLESYITPKTKMFGLCNPHNPMGMCYPKEDLEHILSLSEKYGFYIMNDEIWSDIVYPDAEFTSIYAMGNERNRNTLSVYGFSKSFGMAGLRAGCVYCTDEENFRRMVDASMVEKTIGGIPSLSQIAGMTALNECFYWVDEFREHIRGNRDYVLERIEELPGITCHKPQATFIMFPDIHELCARTGKNSAEIVAYLLDKHKVSIVPGGDRFFGPGSEGHVRICLSTSREILAEGMDRIAAGIRALYG